MADITICMSKECPQRKSCYRAMAVPDRYQSYADFEYVCNEESGFEDFMPILSYDKINKEE